MRVGLPLLALSMLFVAPVAGDPGSETTGLAGEPSLLLPSTAPSPLRRTPRAGRAHGQAPGHDVAATWVRIRVASKGVQEIRGSDLSASGIGLDAYDPRVFRLYVRPGLPLLPEDVIEPAGGLAEVSMRVDGAGDGRFDPADRLLFWGLAASGWHDEYGVPGAAPVDWLDHPYESGNTYWLALDPAVSGQPARWAARDVAPVRPEAAPVDTFRARIHFEENPFYVDWAYETGLLWDRWAARLHSSAPLDLEARLDGIVPGTPARVRARFWGLRSAFPVASHSLAMDLNGVPVARPSWSGGSRFDVDTTGTWLVEGKNHLALTLAPPAPPQFADQVSVHFWELHFARRFVARADSLEFVAPPSPAVAAFTLAPFSTTEADSFLLLDVSDPLAPIALVGASSFDTSGARGVRLHDDRPGSRIFAAAARAWRNPTLERVTVHDLRRGGADYLVLCPDTLVLAASRLADHRRVYPPFPGATAAVVRLSDVYAAYAGGRLDPTAIRNFLADAVMGGAWSPAPSYVCLLGDATTDHAGRSFEPPGASRLLLPTHEAFFAGEAFENDAWFGDFDVAAEAGGVPEIAIGRLPVRGLDAAIPVVGKIILGDIRQPEASAFGGNRLLWSVDDASQRNQPDPLGAEFTVGAEALDREEVPGWVERRKVNLLEHQLETDGTKPSGRDSLIAELRRGTAVWAYVGRGGAFKMADEDLFRRSDIPALEGLPRLPFLVSLTSATGAFTSPSVLLAESLVVDPRGGVLAAFASGANTFAFANRELGKALFAGMFAPPPPGAALESGPTLGAVALGAARGAFDRANNRSYNLLGDPGSRLPYPPRDVRLSLFDDVNGLALADSIPRGRRIRIEGEVRAGRGAAAPFDPSFAGDIHLSVNDAPPIHTYPAIGSPGTYEGNADLVQNARALSAEGRFVTRFVVPVSAHPGEGARVQAVATGFGTASGAIRVTLGATRPDPADTTGPVIAFRFYPDGGIVAPNASYQIDFEDPSGLLLAAASPEHRVTITLDGGPASDITEALFLDRFGSGMARYLGSLPDLGDGDHVLLIAASDHLADPASGASGVHRTVLRVPFRVAGYLASSAVDARALPNPFAPEEGTTLVLRPNVLAGLAEVTIHDVRGRRVRTLRSGATVPPFQLAWNGRDDSGRRLAAGVYPWRAVITSLTGDTVQGFEGRLVLVR